MQIGASGDLGFTRVDADDLHAALFALAQCAVRAEGGDAAGNGKMRHKRIVADDQRHVGVVPHVAAAVPETHARGSDRHLGGLVDGDAGVERGRIDGRVEGARHIVRGGILERVGAVVAGDAARAVLFDNRPQLLGDFIQRGGGGERRKTTVFLAFLRALHAPGMIDLLDHLPAFHAGIAAVDRIFRVGPQFQQAIVVHYRFHRAVGVTEAAVGFAGFSRHGEYAGASMLLFGEEIRSRTPLGIVDGLGVGDAVFADIGIRHAEAAQCGEHAAVAGAGEMAGEIVD